MIKKGYMEISFGWLFAIITGAVILFLAIFLSTKIINTGQSASGAETQKELGNLFEIFESSFESAKSGEIASNIETRIYNRCDEFPDFGRQFLGVTQKSFNRWPKAPLIDEMTSFQNKYIFSENPVQAKKFFVFSKQFQTAFKVADLSYIISQDEEYCFVNTPIQVEKELSNFSIENFVFKKNVLECSPESISVCFSQGKCNVSVSYSSSKDSSFGFIEKDNDNTPTYFYSDSLMYSAIFSDKELYECQLKRVLSRSNSLTKLYLRKSDLDSYLSCSNVDFILKLDEFSETLEKYESSLNLSDVSQLIQEINRFNELSQEECKLW